MADYSDLPIDHVAIAVPDLDQAEAPYLALGLRREGSDEEVAGQQVRVRTLRGAAGLLELLEPTSDDSPIARFLTKRGSGLHHVAFRVRRLDEEIERLTQQGARFVDPQPSVGRAGSRIVFLHPQWTGGVLVELVEHGH